MAARKAKQNGEGEGEGGEQPKVNPRLTASMPGAVLDHDQARLDVREHTAQMNSQGVDAAASSAGGSDAGDVNASGDDATPTATTTNT